MVSVEPAMDRGFSTAPPQAARPSHRHLLNRLAGAQKSSKGAPAYSRYVNRRAGRHLAAVAYRLGLTPNTVTAVSALFSLAGIVVLATIRPSLLSGVAVAGSLVVGYALDSADGQLARLRGGGSPSGEWLDHMIDAAKISSLHLAVLIATFRFLDVPSGWLLVPLGFTIVAAVTFFGMTLNDQLRRAAPMPRLSTSTSALRSLAVIPTDYGLLCLLFVLLGVPAAFFIGYSLLFAANLVFLVLASVKWFGEMKRLKPRPERTI